MKILFLGGNRFRKTSIPLNKRNELEVINLRGKNGERKNITLIFKELLFTFLRQKPDLLLTDNPGVPSLMLLFFKFIGSIPLFVRLRGDFWAERESEIKKESFFWKLIVYIRYSAAKISFKFLDGILPVSHYLKNIVLRRNKNISEKNVKVVKTPLFLIENSPKNHINILSKNKILVILTVTNFNFLGKARALKRAIVSLKEFIKRNNIRWKIAGAGKYMDIIKKIIRQNNLQKQIILLGYEDEIERLYKKSDLFLYFSYRDAYPSVILEAQFFKLPVIANSFGGIKEQVENDKDGYLVDEINKKQLLSKVQILFNDKNKIEELGETAYKKVLRENSIDKICSEFNNAIYNIFHKG